MIVVMWQLGIELPGYLAGLAVQDNLIKCLAVAADCSPAFE